MMKIKNFPRLSSPTALIVILLLFAHICFSQANRETLTNAKIIELVKDGLPEEVIVEKIRQSDCRCDTSTAALTSLNTAKVPKSVIMAMLNPSTGGNNETRTSQPAATRAGGSHTMLSQITEPGIYISTNSKLTAIDPTIYSGTKASNMGSAIWGSIVSRKIRASVRGKSANFQADIPRPEFYFSFSRESSDAAAVMAGKESSAGATSPAEFVLIAMKVNKNSREAILGEVSAVETTVGTPDRYIREFSFEKIRPGLYRVVPKADLATGEYCFFYVRNIEKNGKLFDFSVR